MKTKSAQRTYYQILTPEQQQKMKQRKSKDQNINVSNSKNDYKILARKKDRRKNIIFIVHTDIHTQKKV